MLVITPLVLEFGQDQADHAIVLQNNSASASMTYKVEANCSLRFKVQPVIGVIPPKSSETISIRLKDNEVAKSEDRFLIRCATYSEGDFGSAKEFWAESKKSPSIIPHEKTIIPVRPFASNDDHAVDDTSNERVLKEMQSFHASAPKHLEERAQSTEEAQDEPEVEDEHTDADKDNDDVDDDEIAATLGAADKARDLNLPHDEAVALQTISSLYAQRKEFALAVAWLEEAIKTNPGRNAAQLQGTVRKYLIDGAVDEFTLLCAREEVAKARAHYDAQEGEGDEPVSPPPPPPPPPPRRYAAPTESSMAHRVTASPAPSPIPVSSSGEALDGKKRSAPGSVGKRSTSKVGHLPNKKHGDGEYILEVIASSDAWLDRDLFTNSCHVVLPGPDTTVREMKDMSLQMFRLNPAQEDIELLVAGVRLSDHWRAVDFGLRPGTTRVEMKRKRRTVASKSHSPSRGGVEEMKKQIQLLIDRVTAVEEENSRLKSELAMRTRDLDSVSAKVLFITREKETALEERDALAKRLSLLRRDSGPNSPASLPTRSPKQGHIPTSSLPPVQTTNAVCVVSSAAYLVPAGEDEEEYFEGEEDEGPLVNTSTGDIAVDGHSFRFDSATVLTTSTASPPERVLSLLPKDLFDSVLEGESRTIVLVGETWAGKAAMMEGFDPLSSETSPRGGGKDKIVVSPPRFAKRPGLCEAVAVNLYKSIAAIAAETAMMGGDPLAVYSVHLSGFQTFRDGRVIDFVSSVPPEGECAKTPVPMVTDFEHVYRNMLKKKLVTSRRTSVPCRGDPTDPDSCVVITFELAKRGLSEFKTKLRLIESCGTEAGGMEKNPVIGEIVEGQAVVLAVLHPSVLHASQSVEACSLALEMAKRFNEGNAS